MSTSKCFLAKMMTVLILFWLELSSTLIILQKIIKKKIKLKSFGLYKLYIYRVEQL